MFCAVRPPGHHAGSRGAVPGPDFHENPNDCSNGFCYFNNAAIAAAYARATYNHITHKRWSMKCEGSLVPVIRNVAILDFDSKWHCLNT